MEKKVLNNRERAIQGIAPVQVGYRDYVPRSMKFGCIVYNECPKHRFYESAVVDVDNNGIKTSVVKVSQTTPAEHYRKYRVEDFKLDTMLKAGVPLKVVNVNAVNTIDDVNAINSHLARLYDGDLTIRSFKAAQSSKIENNPIVESQS